jgi:type III pantothenate kinase
MTWLLLDAGNTALKWAFAGDTEPRLVADGVMSMQPDFTEALARSLQASLASLPPAMSLQVGQGGALVALGCSVASDAVMQQVGAAVRRFAPDGLRWVTAQPRFEFRGVALINGYGDPGQLGADRWYAMVGARQAFPGRPLVVVCAGTATTVDWVDAEGRFLGGVIAPGPSLMSDSLAHGTARLPRSAGRAVAAPDNTDDAIATGVAEAQAGLVERRVRALAQRGEPVQVVLAGGHVNELASRLQLGRDAAGISIDERLVLRGLWYCASQARAADAAAAPGRHGAGAPENR